MGHSCLGHPRTIQEVRRILRLHLLESSEPAAPAAVQGAGSGTEGKP